MPDFDDFPGYDPLIGPDSRLGERDQALLKALQNKEREEALLIPADTPLDAYRRRRVRFTLEEMRTQPQAISETLEKEARTIRRVAEALATHRLERLYLVGCGDSLAAGIAVRPIFERLMEIPCEAIQALDYGHYLYHITSDRSAVIAISSSGVTPRTVEALMRACSRGALTVGVSNTPDAPLIQAADFGLYVHAQRKGWPTQASTAAMAMLFAVAIEVGRVLGKDTTDVGRELSQTPTLVAAALERFDRPMAELGASLANKPIFLFAGAGQSWATAQFGAAKVRECTPGHAVAVHLEEFHHYNTQKAGDPLFLISPNGPGLSRALDTMRLGKSWGGLVYALIGPDQSDFDHSADLVLTLPRISEELSPLVYVVPLQLFAYHLAMAQFANAESST